jgi:hypothetical protein
MYRILLIVSSLQFVKYLLDGKVFAGDVLDKSKVPFFSQLHRAF